MTFDPYAPPMTGGAAMRDALPSRRIAVASLAACAAVGPIVGAVTALQFAWGLSRFGGLEYVSRVVGLAALRAHAPTGALVMTTMAATVIAHGAAQKRGTNGGHAALLGVTVLAAYPLLCVAILSGGALLMRAAYALPFDAFLDFGGSVTWSDAASGMGVTALYALVAIALLPPLLRLAAAKRWGLAAKLVVGWLGAQATCFVLQTAIAAVVR